VIVGDIANIDFDSIEADVVIGGPPCQDFSVVNLKRKGIDSSRGQLYLHYARALASIKPKAFVFENVPGLLNANGGQAYKSVVQTLAKPSDNVEYSIIFCKVVDSSALGVPRIEEESDE
jgi:DNA (cytosine-5)-methyltransferase 1